MLHFLSYAYISVIITLFGLCNFLCRNCVEKESTSLQLLAQYSIIMLDYTLG